MSLNYNALLTVNEFNTFWTGAMYEEQDPRLIAIINATSVAFENICNRRLKEMIFTPTESEEDLTASIPIVYDERYSFFDNVQGNFIYLPTFPVDSITSMTINGTAVTASDDYDADEGYILYKKTGKIVYDQEFYEGYYKNVRIKWQGGYPAASPEMDHLKFLAFNTIKDILNSPSSGKMKSEKIGRYQYTLYDSEQLTNLSSFSPEVYSNLMYYRKESIV